MMLATTIPSVSFVAQEAAAMLSGPATWHDQEKLVNPRATWTITGSQTNPRLSLHHVPMEMASALPQFIQEIAPANHLLIITTTPPNAAQGFTELSIISPESN